MNEQREQFDAGWNAALDVAAKACEEQQAIFGTEQYAVNQPLSSFGERFACGRCVEAIRALAQVGTRPQGEDCLQASSETSDAVAEGHAPLPLSQSITPPEVGGELVAFIARVGSRQVERRIDSLGELLRLINGGAKLSGVTTLSTPEVVDGPSGVWSKAVYAAADKARNDALAIDPNDQMSALAVAVDAALACEASDAKGLVEALEGVLNIAECWEIIDGGKNINLAASEAVIRARTALSQHRGVS